MNDKFIKELKSLTGETLKDKIFTYIKNGNFSIKELLKACRGKEIKVPADVLNGVAFLYDEEISEKNAFSIYEYAAELGDTHAMQNVAFYYFHGRKPCAVDFSKSRYWCEKSINGKNVSANIILALIHIEEKEHNEAMKCLKQVTSTKCTEEEVEKARNLEKKIMMKYLKKIYTEVDHSDHDSDYSDDSSVGIGNMNLGSEKTPGWISLSDSDLDGFDIDSCDEMSEKIKALEDLIDSKKKKKKKDPKYIEGLEEKLEEVQQDFADYVNMQEKLIQRQVQTENRFFSPCRTKNKQTFLLARELESRRINGKKLGKLDIGGQSFPTVSARQLITAERSTVDTSIQIKPYSGYSWYQDKIGWKSNPMPNIQNKRPDANYTYDETIDFFGSQIEYCQRVNSHYNHTGDYYMRNLGEYPDIIEVINNITGINTQNEKKLAKIMLKFSRDGESVKLDLLRNIKADATESDVEKLNRIFYHCFIKEISRWMLPKDESHNLPLATVQARALHLIIGGHLTMNEVFSKDALCGVFTATSVGADMDALREKIIRINTKYEEYVLRPLPSYAKFRQNHPNGKILTSRKGLHSELKKTFGGENDTDGEGYESDDERENLYKKVMSVK